MGSHYSQCFASHQTIAPGDKCYALAIRQQGTYDQVEVIIGESTEKLFGVSHAAINPDAYWTPVSNFIEGVYLRDGDIDISKTDENLRRLLVFVRKMLKQPAVTAEGKNSVHDLAFDFVGYVAQHCPVLSAHLTLSPGVLTLNQAPKGLFEELTNAWTHVDDVAFKHRVFYSDYRGHAHPLQFTLVHQACYDDLLSRVRPQWQTQALFDDGLKALAQRGNGIFFRERFKATPLTDSLREMTRISALIAFVEPMLAVGHFDGIDYNEEALGLGESLLAYLQGKLEEPALFAQFELVLRDRLVLAVMESFRIKIAPKCLWWEDDENCTGRAYANFVRRVSAQVSRSRRELNKS